jgi:hypothetical protein
MIIGWSCKKIFKISTNQNTLWALAAMLDFRSAPKTKILYDHPMNISAKFGSNLFCGFRKKDENMKFP